MNTGVGYFPKGDTDMRGPTHIVVGGSLLCGAKPKGFFHYCSFIVGGYRPECKRCLAMTDEFNIRLGPQQIVACKDIRTGHRVIRKGTLGHISRVSPRLRGSHVYNNQRSDVICVKFPGVKSFFCMNHEVKKVI